MKAKTKLTKLWSFLLSLVMLLSLLPTTALAASPDASNVFVNGNINFYNPTRLYYKNGDFDASFTGTSTDFNAAYDPATGTLTLKDYNGKGITVGGVGRTDITVVLEGTNIINDGSLENAVGGDITVTSSDGGTLSITRTLSGGNAAIGIETGLSASYTTGNVTIKGNAKVTINMTHNGTSTYEKAYGIFAKENITISENASVNITCATPNNTTGGGNCNGLYAAKDVTIDTNGTIKIDVTNAGRDKDNGYSYGVYHMRTATLTKVGNMEVQWKKEGNSTTYSGGAFTRGASFRDTDHAINVDTTNCYASYRYGTPRIVTVQDGTVTGPGVKYANGSGYFLAGDKVNITPATKKGRSGEEIPFKEWTFSDVMLDKSATTASNSFTVPGKDVTVTATHNPFDGAPTFTPIGTTGTQGTLTFKTVVKADDAYEGFRLVKEGNENNESSYISIRSDTTSTSSPYEYSYKASIYNLNEGNYYVVAYLNNHYYLGEKFTVSYTAAPTTYTVSFDANGGSGTMADVTGVSGEYTLPENGFTAPSGKQFKAWSVGGVEKAAGDKITVTANTTVTAVWEDIPVVTYTVSFDANGGTGTMADVTGVSGEYTLPANGFTAPAGKQFKAWSVGGVEKAAGDKITVTANTTVTAVWENIPVVTYTVSFDANGGTGTMADVTGVSGEYTLPANGFTAPAGKQFKAWSVGGSEKAVGDKITVTANTTVTAVWEAVEYNVTVTDGKATVGAGSVITEAAADTTVTLTANPAPAGKIFDKWVVESGSVALADSNSATTTFTMPAEAVSVKATYKNAPHMHTYNQETVKLEALKTPADCTHNAVYFKSCSCGAISTTDTFVAMDTALDHAYGSDWKYDSTNHWHECSRCHDKKDEAAHDYGSDNVCDTCGYDKTVPHTHNLTLVAAKAATCTTAGNSAYYTCDGCDKWFADATGSVEITDKTSVKIPAPGHTADTEWKSDADNHWKECTVVGCGVIIEGSKAAHTAGEWIIDTPATATTSGSKHKECTVCGYTMTTETIPATGSGGGGGGSGGSYDPTYSITADKTENGSVSVSPKSASKGDTVTVTVTPDKGYTLETLTVLDKNGKELKLTEKNGKYTFTMPAGKVEVKVTFMDDNTMLNYFVDVKAGDYFYDAVLWAAEKGITSGTDATHFSPNAACTRAQIVTFLWRAAGSPEPKSTGSFADVPTDNCYAKAVAWAVENGITGGTGDGKFSPNATCTREQAVAFLYRASGSPAVSGGSAFNDVAANAYYADAVAWAEKNEITGGIGGGLFGSGNDCTRAQIVTFLYRAFNK